MNNLKHIATIEDGSLFLELLGIDYVAEIRFKELPQICKMFNLSDLVFRVDNINVDFRSMFEIHQYTLHEYESSYEYITEDEYLYSGYIPRRSIGNKVKIEVYI